MAATDSLTAEKRADRAAYVAEIAANMPLLTADQIRFLQPIFAAAVDILAARAAGPERAEG